MTLQEAYTLLGGNLQETLALLGDEALLMKHLRLFPQDDSVARLRSAVEAGDQAGARQAAHALRGTCVTLGLGYLAQAVERLDMALLEREHAHALAVIALLEESDTARAMLVHELRTPLQAILGTAELHPGAEGMARIALAARHIAAILEEPSPRQESFSMADMLRDTVALLRSAMGPDCPPVALETALDHDSVLGDAPRIRQVLLNLLTNAVHGSAKNDTITLRTTAIDGGVVLWVEDQGSGMSEAAQAQAFRPRWRGRTDAGMGLGLPIARALAEEMGGTITLTSVPGGGTTVTVRLPLSPAVEKGVEAVEPRRSFDGLRALLAEDDRLSAEVSAELLAGLGLETRVVSSGDEAVRLARESAFDCVFFDAHIPGTDSLAALRAIRAALPEAPVFALTGGVRPGEEQRLRAAGMRECLLKPVGAEKLARLLSAYFPDR